MAGRLTRLTGGQAFTPLFILWGLHFCDRLDQAAFAVLLPDIRDAFGLGVSGVLTLVALTLPATIAVGVPLAYLADRTSRVRMATIGVAVWGLFSVASALVVNVSQLVAARIGAGLATATDAPTHNSLLADYYPPAVRSSVYAFHQSALNASNFVSPLAAGVVATYFGWRMPFLLFAVPTAAFVLAARRLREPARGYQDRLVLGADEVTAATEQPPPRFVEATRLIMSAKSIRRLTVALPFLGASAFGLNALMALYWSDVHGLSVAERGFVAAGAEPFAIAGLIVFAPVVNRWVAADAGRGLRLLALSGVGIAVSMLFVAVAPSLPIAVAAFFVSVAVGSVLLPGIYSILSQVLPARARSLGFVYASLWLLPGVLVLPVIGRIGESYGLRVAIAVLVPAYICGSVIMSTAGRSIAEDIETTRLHAMADHEVRAALTEGRPKILMVRGLAVSYDGVQVLFGLDLDVQPGEIVALLGTNGAGKSTVLKAIAGLVDPASGAIYFDGADITHADALDAFGRGVILMPGGRSVFPTMTVEEHIRLAVARTTGPDDEAEVTALLELFPRLAERWHTAAGDLSGGEQQMLGLMVALLARPKLLMIDELSLGLAPSVVESLLTAIRQVNQRGTAIVIVEQSVNVALTIADRAYFLEKGAVRFEGATRDLLERDDILRAVFLTRHATSPATSQRPGHEWARAESRVLLEVSQATRSFGGLAAIDDVSLRVDANEIVGIIGPNGAGKTTLFDLISGFLALEGGSIILDGVEVTHWPAERRFMRGLGRSFQDARIFPSLTVAQNLALSLERHLPIRDPLADALQLPAVTEQEGDIGYTVDELIELMNLGAFRDKFVGELSTGSRRIVDLAMAIAHQPTVLLLDEPSSGIAQRETEALGPLLRNIRDEVGCALLLIEHDMSLVTATSERMLALDLGRVIANGQPDEVVTDEAVIRSYLGTDSAAINRSGPHVSHA